VEAHASLLREPCEFLGKAQRIAGLVVRGVQPAGKLGLRCAERRLERDTFVGPARTCADSVRGEQSEAVTGAREFVAREEQVQDSALELIVGDAGLCPPLITLLLLK
jgi:hypothetical protein